MDEKERLRLGLQHTRRFTDLVLADIVEQDDWIRRPVPGSNHALWIAGHLAVATNAFIGWVDASQRVELGDYAELFGKGSDPLDQLQAYPNPDDVQRRLQERGNAFLQLLHRTEPEEFSREVSEGPEFMHDVGSVFQMAIWHESLHAGQLTVIHRMIGRPAFTARSTT